MKKTYILPTTCVLMTELGEGLLQGGSPETVLYKTTKTVEGNSDIGVKSNNSSYNVWDDDWSE